MIDTKLQTELDILNLMKKLPLSSKKAFKAPDAMKLNEQKILKEFPSSESLNFTISDFDSSERNDPVAESGAKAPY